MLNVHKSIGNAELYQNTKLDGCVQFYPATRRVMTPLIWLMEKKTVDRDHGIDLSSRKDKVSSPHGYFKIY